MKRTLITLLAFGIVGCGSSSSNDDASLRVLHLSPDAPAVDVLVDGQTFLSDVSYPTASAYLSTPAVQTEIRVNAAGSDTSVIVAEVPFAENTSYTVVAANLLANIEPLVLIDERGAAPSGTALVRVLHGAPSAPAVDVYVTLPGESLDGLTPVLANVPFKVSSDYLELPAGDYQVRVTVAGTQTVAIDSGELTLAEGTRITAVARDAAGSGAPFELLVLDDR